METNDEDEDDVYGTIPDNDELPELPGAWKERPSWDELESALATRQWYRPKTARNAESRELSAETFAEAARSVGLAALPPSYLEYVSRYGHTNEWTQRYRQSGRRVYYLTVYSPLSLDRHLDYLAANLDANSDFSKQAHAVAEQLRPLIPIGTNASRILLCWDPRQRYPNGELGLCFIDWDGDPDVLEELRHDCGTNLLDVLKYYEHRT